MSKLLSKCCGAHERVETRFINVETNINVGICSACRKPSEFERLADDEEIDHEG